MQATEREILHRLHFLDAGRQQRTEESKMGFLSSTHWAWVEPTIPAQPLGLDQRRHLVGQSIITKASTAHSRKKKNSNVKRIMAKKQYVYIGYCCKKYQGQSEQTKDSRFGIAIKNSAAAAYTRCLQETR